MNHDSAGNFEFSWAPAHCFPLPWNHKQICNDFRSTVSPLSLFLTTCVWIHSTELCINHIRLRITENRGLSYPGQWSLLGHYQRLEDNAENRFCSVCMRASEWAQPQRSRPPQESVHSPNELTHMYLTIQNHCQCKNITNRNPIFLLTLDKPAV